MHETHTPKGHANPKQTAKRTGANKSRELSPEEAREKRKYHLALAAQNAAADEHQPEDMDPADSTLATLILPGG